MILRFIFVEWVFISRFKFTPLSSGQWDLWLWGDLCLSWRLDFCQLEWCLVEKSVFVQLVAEDWLSQRGWRLGMGLGGALGANSEI